MRDEIDNNLFSENQTFKIVGSENDPKINNIITLLIKCNEFLTNYLEIGNRLFLNFKKKKKNIVKMKLI